MLNAIGTVAEYNPFHNGHLHNMNTGKASAADDSVFVSVMSGDFVQRGEPSIFNKHVRAEAACRCGANIVVELPLPWCLMSAESFAEAGVFLLNSMRVSSVCFGTENGDISALKKIAEVLGNESVNDDIKATLRSEPDLSYAEAREMVVGKYLNIGNILKSPNSILAVEYLKAINKHNMDISPIPVLRIGPSHDSTECIRKLKSASLIRKEISENGTWRPFVPNAAASVFLREIETGRGPVCLNDLETPIISRLTMLNASDYDALPDAGNGAGRRLYKALVNSGNLDAAVEQSVTKRYTLSRMKRITLCAALGIKTKDMKALPSYIRILACDEKGRNYLHDCSESFLLPVITKPSHINKLSFESKYIFELNSKAADFYSLAYSNPSDFKFGDDYRTSPFII